MRGQSLLPGFLQRRDKSQLHSAWLLIRPFLHPQAMENKLVTLSLPFVPYSETITSKERKENL